MSHELYYTSAPKGLRPGSRGFCTVAATQGLPAPLAEKVESLSGYRPLYPPLDPKAHLNPVAHSHVRITVSGKTYSVLSRISPAGLDYSQRANKFAHHVILETGELPVGGPAWLLAQPAFMESQWDSEVRVIPSGRGIPNGDQGPSVCRAWQEITGDAGWGGVLADWFQRDANRQVYVVIEPGMDPLPLIAETLALLTPERRWQVTFSTYFTGLPQGMPCLWRCVIKDSPEVVNAGRVRGQQILNLCEPLGQAPDGNLVEQARTGRKVVRGGAPAPPVVAGSPDPAIPWQESVAGRQPDQRAWKRAAYDVEPIPSSQGKSSPSMNPSPVSRGGEGRGVKSSGKRGKKTWLWPALGGLICGLGAGMLAASLWWRPLAVSGLSYQSVPKENGALAADEKEIKNVDKSVQELTEKTQARDKEFKEVSESLTKTKAALAKEMERGSKLAMEKKEKENTIAELRDELTRLKDGQNNSKPDPGRQGNGLDQNVTAVADGYFRLPEWSKSSINESKLKADKNIKSFGLEPGADYNLKLLVGDSSNLKSVDEVSSVKVGLPGGATFAKFDLKDGKLSFHWNPQAEDKYESAQALLRNCILEISSAGKSRKIALREPVREKEMEIIFPSLVKTGTQDVYTSTADFLSWDNQGPPSQEVLFDSIRLEIDKASFTPDSPDKKPFQTLVFGESVKQFKWGVVGKSQDGMHVGSLTLGPSNPLRKPPKVRIVSLVAYTEVHGVYVEVARIGKTPKK